MTPSETLPTSRLLFSGRPDGPHVGLEAVLIRVPHVRYREPVAAPGRDSARDFPRRTARAGRPRRRLKREVRLAGRALAGLLAVALLLNCGAVVLSAPRSARGSSPLPHGPGASPVAAERQAAEPSGRPSIVLSIEPAGAAAEGLEDRPVVLPGYLLPDDSHEEAVHEGS